MHNNIPNGSSSTLCRITTSNWWKSIWDHLKIIIFVSRVFRKTTSYDDYSGPHEGKPNWQLLWPRQFRNTSNHATSASSMSFLWAFSYTDWNINKRWIMMMMKKMNERNFATERSLTSALQLPEAANSRYIEPRRLLWSLHSYVRQYKPTYSIREGLSIRPAFHTLS